MENSNHVFAESADWFVHGPEDGQREIEQPTLLDRAALDYSIDSLRAVDHYLAQIRGSAPENLASGAWLGTVLRAGSYVGEVFARASAKVLNWYEYPEFVLHHPEAKKWLGATRSLENNAVLATPDRKFMTAPHNKVCKFLWDGPEDSVWYYVQTFLEKV